MTIDEAIDGLKRIFSNYELDLPCTDSLEILSSTICKLEELKWIKETGLFTKAQLELHKECAYKKSIDDFVKLAKEHDFKYRAYDITGCVIGFIEFFAEQLKDGGE